MHQAKYSSSVMPPDPSVHFYHCRLVLSSAAVFKLGSADQRGSATGSHGVRERIPKSSNCLQFLTIYDPYVFKFAHISQSLSLSALRGSVAVLHDRLSVDVS